MPIPPVSGAPAARRRRVRPRLVPAALAGICAFALVLSATEPPGPGLDPDAMSYLGAAGSLVRGEGLRVPSARWDAADSTAPLEHFPPGLSLALAVPIRAGMEPVQAARLVNATAAFATAAALVALVADAAGLAAGIALVLALAATPAIADTYLSVLSEPLCVACLTIALWLALRPRPRLLAAGCALAAGVLVRYAAIAFVGTMAIWALARRGDRRGRWSDAARAAGPPLAALGAWALTAHREAGATTIRDLGFYGGLGDTLRQGLTTLAVWLAPGTLPDGGLPVPWIVAALTVAVFLIALVSAGVAAARVSVEPRDARALSLMGWTALGAAAYGAFVLASRLLADPAIPLDDRMLSPVVLMAELLIVAGAAALWRSTAGGVRLLLVLSAVAWGAASASVVAGDAAWALDTGSDFAGWTWRHSPLVAWARADGAGETTGGPHVLFTNWPAAVWFHTGRATRELPDTTDPVALAALRESLVRLHGALIGFTAPNVDVVPPDTLAARLGLTPVLRAADGTVWLPASGAAAPAPPTRAPR